MIKSMTGYGKSVCQIEGKQVSVEVRTLNSKTLDINLKLPVFYRELEPILRNLLAQHLVRGKAELSIGIDNNGSTSAYTLNKPLLEKYYTELRQLARDLGSEQSEGLLASLLRLPDVLKQQSQEAGEQEINDVISAVTEAIGKADAFRQSEGTHLYDDLLARSRAIDELLQQISPLEQARMTSLKNRLLKNLNDLQQAGQPDPNRFEQELIYYLEKLDISEEKVRLRKHLDYFEETLNLDESSGKKLGFITQEIGREINTIGSKANDAAIQKIVVQMKDELEKMKEQLMNIL
jgi:uncharacterized protein (TIGR00255 family)